METLFRTHQYLLEHLGEPVHRSLMDEINWRDRLIGIKGSRGVGKTTFLLQYAKENFSPKDRRCLYVNMNNFLFQTYSLVRFAGEFYKAGGQVLLIDQIFKVSSWSHVLHECYEKFPMLKIIFTGSTVMRLKDENPELNGICHSYSLRGFSFREYLNMMAGTDIRPYTLRELENRHERIAKEVCEKCNPLEHFQAYLHHGYYPFFLEKKNFSENLLKTMNMMVEVDILLINQMEQKNLNRIKKLLYLLATGSTGAPNVSQLAAEVQTSRTTIMNYIKFLSDARLVNMIYKKGEGYPKKPARLLMHNTNLMHGLTPGKVNVADMMETFFQNAVSGKYKLNVGDRSCNFILDGKSRFRIQEDVPKRKATDVIYISKDKLQGEGQEIPLWMFGLLY
ncbi:MAG: ATP-binding protein [Bacteroidaceae bacterium]|nr:ATP-binding protein [Bacteroidaceae bacterium]